MPTNPLIFNPSPEQADQVIHDLSSPHLTLRDVAELHNTTIQSLTLWIALPDTSQRLSNINNAVVARSRHVACNYLARATETVITSLDAYIDEEKHIPVRPNSIEDREQRRRSRQTACHAVSLLLRIAKFNPAPPRPSDPTRKRRYTTTHSNRINEVLTKVTSESPSRREGLGWVCSSPDQQSSDDPANDSKTNNPNELSSATTNSNHHNRITDLDTTGPSRRSEIRRGGEGLGWVRSSHDKQNSDDPAQTPLTTAPATTAEPQAPTACARPLRFPTSGPLPKRGDPDWEPWMANGELPLSVEKKLRQQSDSTTPPNTAATLQARAGAPQPFTPLTISAKNSNGKAHSCSTPCASGCPNPHPP